MTYEAYEAADFVCFRQSLGKMVSAQTFDWRDFISIHLGGTVWHDKNLRPSA